MYVLKLQDRVEGWWNTSRPMTLVQAWKSYRHWQQTKRHRRPRGIMIVRVTGSMMGLATGPSILEDCEA